MGAVWVWCGVGKTREHRYLRLGVCLLLKELALANRVVELRIRVAHFSRVDKHLKALRHAVLAAVPLGEGRHYLGVVADEAGVDELIFQVVAHQLVQ